VNKRNVNIRTLNGLNLAKKEFQYEVKLREQILESGVNQFGSSLKESAMNTFRSFTRKALTLALIKLFQSRWRN